VALPSHFDSGEVKVMGFLQRFWRQQDGQDVAEYAVMLAVILAIALATIHVIGANALKTFSSIASTVGGQ
jgi:Flp pilus assembly pilin Flp